MGEPISRGLSASLIERDACGVGFVANIRGEASHSIVETGIEVLKRLDAQVNFDWADKPAAPGVPTEDFSVRWTGQVQAQHAENYTFHVETDDGVRVWLGERQIIDEWRQQSTTVVSQPIALNAGQFYPLTIEYFSAKPPAMAKLKWSSPSTPIGVIPASRLFPPRSHTRNDANAAGAPGVRHSSAPESGSRATSVASAAPGLTISRPSTTSRSIVSTQSSDPPVASIGSHTTTCTPRRSSGSPSR